jgi:hypothetical protein
MTIDHLKTTLIKTAGAGGEAMNLDELTKLEAAMTPGPWTHPIPWRNADAAGIVALRNAAPALIECAELLWKHAVIPCGDCNGMGCHMGPTDKDDPCDSCGGSGSTLPDEVAAAIARLEGNNK